MDGKKNDEEEFKGRFVSKKEIQFYILGHIPNKVSGKFLDVLYNPVLSLRLVEVS